MNIIKDMNVGPKNDMYSESKIILNDINKNVDTIMMKRIHFMYKGIPKTIGNFKYLKKMILVKCVFGGEIPETIYIIYQI